MKQSLPLYGILAAMCVIAGLGMLARHLIFSETSMVEAYNPDANKSGFEEKDSQSGVEKNLGRVAHKSQDVDVTPTVKETQLIPSGQADQAADLAGAIVTSPVEKKSTLVPGSALKDKRLKEMTGVYGTKIAVIKVQPQDIEKVPAEKQQKVIKKIDQQSWFSKLLYGDRAKIAAEKRAKAEKEKQLAEEKKVTDVSERLDSVLQGAHRKGYKRARDKYRHPKETLLFLGLRPEMTVIEMWPGEGWYSEIIAPVLKGKGVFYAASWDRELKTRAIDAALKRYTENYVLKPETFGKVILTSLSERRFDIGPSNSADFIFSSRNMYSWMRKKMVKQVFEAMFKALKPGGILGIVDHRQDAGTYQDPRAISGYVTERHVINAAKKAGFVLVGKSEINANPKDIKKYPRGVFSLPPVLKQGKRHKKKYLAIGESDRMTLKFMKPKG